MKQREIWEVYFDPVLGSEQAGRRPALIVSGNLANNNLNTVIACPLTSNLKNYQGNLILEPTESNGLSKISEVMTIHIRSLSKERFLKKIGFISKSDFQTVKVGLEKIIKY
ncbi:type II toxin-antitoxin system PemK/MazF family toxin [Aequorivita marina]|uniref:type II toxin-antitoxin system PemK/MazF family toxin n=1 Tax=Aequorivita marina TaxID=3073654 RepID=UPI0028758C58|nr:type II toxin-antitoxin system PemK/MazF family toxin [Aequorivita sp. S2608]MDS1297233.1 type II toxin-antitoxin system PemK/MazF family toxin [Aequorivita sp. S2608]